MVHDGRACSLFEYHTFLHHSQTCGRPWVLITVVWVPYIFTSFSNYAWPCNRVPSVWVPYIFTSFSNNRLFLWDPGEFEYHTFLHHSQTHAVPDRNQSGFEYHTFLHHSQTRSKHERNAGGLSTIHFYIILKRLSGRPGFLKGLSTIHFYIILKPPVGIVNTLPLFEYHTFLHHSQTKVVWVFIAV